MELHYKENVLQKVRKGILMNHRCHNAFIPRKATKENNKEISYL